MRVGLEEVLQHEPPLREDLHQAEVEASALVLVPRDRVAVVDVGRQERPASTQKRRRCAIPHNLLCGLVV